MHFDRKAFDIDRRAADSATPGGQDMPFNALSQSAAEGFDIGGVAGEGVDQF